jgi:hypothetical protein
MREKYKGARTLSGGPSLPAGEILMKIFTDSLTAGQRFSGTHIRHRFIQLCCTVRRVTPQPQFVC